LDMKSIQVLEHLVIKNKDEFNHFILTCIWMYFI